MWKCPECNSERFYRDNTLSIRASEREYLDKNETSTDWGDRDEEVADTDCGTIFCAECDTEAVEVLEKRKTLKESME